jgi:phenylalanyl-tRNA synthetase beta chain
MRISYRWLKDYVNLPEQATPEDLARRLTFSGLELESLTSLAQGLEKVVVGQILERNQHPNADRLSVTKIDIGLPEKLEIVCGAQNIAAGQKIPVATLGAVIPNGLEIKAAKIRGVPSQGMLCSLDELLLPKEWQVEDGIFLLDAEAKVGTPLAEYLGREDWILELNVTANRGDALSHLGVAREAAALYGVTAKLPELSLEPASSGKIRAEVVNQVSRDLCPRYFGRVVEGVKVGPSPNWLKQKLETVGIRSINNVVDITSFVMFEMGQPLHAFDADKLRQGGDTIHIGVREARAGERFLTLGDKEVELVPEDLVICAGEAQEAVALAGVMGGQNSEVDDGTENVFLEAAEFHPVRVRKTGRRLSLLTDAGYRFERGVDTGRVRWALDRATDLLQKFASGRAGAEASSAGAEELEPMTQIRLRISDLERTLGRSPDQPRVIQILRGLGIVAEAAAGEQGVVNVQVPRWRRDLRRTIDLVEEVARIWGFENLESRLPLGGVGETEAVETGRRSNFQVRRVRRHLASLGFFESLNYGFTSPDQLRKAFAAGDLEKLVEIANPVTADFSVMKPSLLTGLLENAALNFAHRRPDLRLFEVRRVFRRAPENEGTDPRLDTGVAEQRRLALLMTGAEVDEFWEGKAKPVDFYSIKGTLESILELLNVGGVQFEPGSGASFLHPGQCATLKQGKKSLGVVGRLHPRVEKSFDFEQDIFFADLDLDSLVANERKQTQFRAFSNFPRVERDFSALVSDTVNAQMIRALVSKAAKPLMKDFYFFDVYRGSRVPTGHVSYAFRLILGADDHTLTDAEISSVQEKVMKELEREFQAKFAGLN